MKKENEHNNSIKFAHKQRGLELGDKARLATYFERYTLRKNNV